MLNMASVAAWLGGTLRWVGFWPAFRLICLLRFGILEDVKSQLENMGTENMGTDGTYPVFSGLPGLAKIGERPRLSPVLS